jgi:hypothetical protein
MSPDADATALPPFWPARQHTALHDELHARPPLLVRPGSIVSCWVNWRMDPAGAERALAALCEPRASRPRHRAAATMCWSRRAGR